MYLLRHCYQEVETLTGSASRRSFLLAFVLLAVVLAGLGALVCWLGSPLMNGCPWDVPVVLDGAWRILSGQVPHRDFYNFLGDMPFYMTALGMKLGGPCASAIDYGNVVLMAALVLPAFAVARRRTSALPALLFCIFLALLVITPRPLGNPYDYTDHAMMYNRYGEAVLSLLGLIIFLPPRTGWGRSWRDRAEAVLAGLSLVALLGCKMNYFVMGLVFFGAACGLGLGRGGWPLWSLTAAVVFLAMALALTGIPLSDLIDDYRMGASNNFGNRVHPFLKHAAKEILFLPLLLLLIYEVRLGQAGGEDQPRPWQYTAVVVILFGGGLLLLSSNSQPGEMPLLALAVLYGTELILRQAVPPGEAPLFAAARHLGAILVLSLFLLPPIATELKTFRCLADRQIQKDWDSPAALQTTHLNDFRFVRHGTHEHEMQDYMGELTEGMELLRRYASPEIRLNALIFSDPFHLALGWRPSTGGTISLCHVSCTQRFHPPLARLLGNATHILQYNNNAKFMHYEATPQEIYGAQWDALHLEVVGKSENFDLLKIPERAARKTEGSN